MGSFIKQKKEKILAVFDVLGTNIDEKAFIETFIRLYPKEWELIRERWLEEEQNTPPGKRHPMPSPDIYMKEMYRNHRKSVGAR